MHRYFRCICNPSAHMEMRFFMHSMQCSTNICGFIESSHQLYAWIWKLIFHSHSTICFLLNFTKAWKSMQTKDNMDNYAKFIMDALSNGDHPLFNDDMLIISISCHKKSVYCWRSHFHLHPVVGSSHKFISKFVFQHLILS